LHRDEYKAHPSPRYSLVSPFSSLFLLLQLGLSPHG
jgi:hypothetical protein